jgi:DNA-binding transcriptional MerR regulator
MAATDTGWMTIENLSIRSGVTTRNIRAYQSRGLLPAPVARSGERAAFYTAEHLARLRLVSRLQERGFSLAGIADLLDSLAAGKTLEQVLGIESAIVESEAEDESRIVDQSEFRALLPDSTDLDASIERLVAVGLVDRHERAYRIRNPRVFELGLAAVQAGIPVEALLDEFVRLRGDLHEVALRFVALFTRHVLDPFLEAGMPKEQLDAVVEHLKRLRQLAVSATETLMRQAISDETEAAARANLAHLTKPAGPK